MKRFAAVVGIISGILFAFGKNPTALMASSYVLLVFIGMGKFITGDKKPFGQPFWTALFMLFFLPFLVCNFINWIGLPIFIAAIVLSAVLYIYFNTSRDHKPETHGGNERTPLDPYMFDESWDEREVH